MGHLSSMLKGLASSLSIKRKTKTKKDLGNSEGREAVETISKKRELILKSSGIVKVDGSKNLACVFSKRGEKGANQDRCIVWEV